MATEVEIALVGDPTDDWGAIDRAEWERDWDERRKVTVSVESRNSLALIVDRAAERLALPPAPYGQEYRHSVDVTTALHDWRRFAPLIVVDDDDRALWSAWDYRLIPYAQFVRAVEAGAMPGDAGKLFLVLRYPGGDGVGLSWPDLIESIETAWEVGRIIAEAGGIYAAYRIVHDLVQARLRRGEELLQEHAHRWDQRDASPASFRAFLGERAWDSRTLARLLGCSDDDAKGVLELFGYARSEADGLWHPAYDDAARIMTVILDEASAYAHEDRGPGGKREYRRRAEHFLRTGEVLPHPWDQDYYDDFDDDLGDLERRERLRKRAVAAAIAAVGGAVGFALGRLRR
jgi:hypothetical protein